VSTLTPDEYVLGACMLDQGAVRTAANIIGPEDFWSHVHGGMFRAMMKLASDGEVIEPITVLTRAQEDGVRGVEITNLFRMLEGTGSAASVEFYAEQVKANADRHRLKSIATKLMREASDPAWKPAMAAQSASEGLKNLQAGGPQRMRTKTLEEILADPEDHDWLIPDLLERGDRLIITGYEGGGKTTWIRQLVLCMAAGIHPTTLNRLDKPLTVLVVDAENTESQWRAQTRGMVTNMRRMSGVNPAVSIHVHARGRIDITKDATLGEIHRLVDEHEPHVLAIGPIYKLVSTGINNDTEAAPVITALDSLRDRGLALIMEGHSVKPNGQTGHRDLSPRGSAALMGWPEFGFGITLPDPEGDPSLHRIVRWRGDRDTGRQWPRDLRRGGLLPWTGDTVSRGAQNHINNVQAQDHYAAYN
jgi:replicative DNA helicase